MLGLFLAMTHLSRKQLWLGQQAEGKRFKKELLHDVGEPTPEDMMIEELS
jgi:hypothetical protein